MSGTIAIVHVGTPLGADPLVAQCGLHARSLLARTLDQAAATNAFSRLVVATDHPGVAAQAQALGATAVPAAWADSLALASASVADALRAHAAMTLCPWRALRTPAHIAALLAQHSSADAPLASGARPRRLSLAEPLEPDGSMLVGSARALRTPELRVLDVGERPAIDPALLERPGIHTYHALRSAFFERQRPALAARLARCRLVVFDFDGVMTTNHVLVHQDASEAVLANRTDGLGITLLREHNIPACVISMEENPVVQRRCEKLKIECIQGQRHKLPVLERLLRDKGVEPEHAAYVGNDANDLDCMAHVACGIAVADAHPDVLAAAEFATRLPGGHGAVREVCDLILARPKP